MACYCAVCDWVAICKQWAAVVCSPKTAERPQLSTLQRAVSSIHAQVMVLRNSTNFAQATVDAAGRFSIAKGGYSRTCTSHILLAHLSTTICHPAV